MRLSEVMIAAPALTWLRNAFRRRMANVAGDPSLVMYQYLIKDITRMWNAGETVDADLVRRAAAGAGLPPDLTAKLVEFVEARDSLYKSGD